MKTTKHNIRMSFMEWFKYIRAERIVNDTVGHREHLHHNTICLLKNKPKEYIYSYSKN